MRYRPNESMNKTQQFLMNAQRPKSTKKRNLSIKPLWEPLNKSTVLRRKFIVFGSKCHSNERINIRINNGDNSGFLGQVDILEDINIDHPNQFLDHRKSLDLEIVSSKLEIKQPAQENEGMFKLNIMILKKKQ